MYVCKGNRRIDGGNGNFAICIYVVSFKICLEARSKREKLVLLSNSFSNKHIHYYRISTIHSIVIIQVAWWAIITIYTVFSIRLVSCIKNVVIVVSFSYFAIKYFILEITRAAGLSVFPSSVPRKCSTTHTQQLLLPFSLLLPVNLELPLLFYPAPSHIVYRQHCY